MFGLDDNTTFFLVLVVTIVSLFLASFLSSQAEKARAKASIKDNLPRADWSASSVDQARWWFDALLEGEIHTMLVGKTRSGKSYLARAMVTGFTQSGHQVLIIDPHAKPEDWAGLPVVGRGKKYQEIELALENLITEADKRFELLGSQPGYKPAPLEVFIDEARGIAQHCLSGPEVFKEGSSEWAKIGIRLHLLTQSALVKSLGFEGEGQLRENYNMVYLKNQATARAPYLARMTRPALFEYEDRLYPIDTTWLPAYLQTTQPDLQMVEKDLLGWARSFANKEGGLQVPFTSSENQPIFELKTTARTSELDIIKALLKGGLTPTQVVEILGGNRQKRFEQINQVNKDLQEMIK